MIVLRVGWLVERHRAEAVEVAGCTRYPWTGAALDAARRRRNVIGMAAEDLHGRLIGFTLYALSPHELEVLALAVGPYVRRQGVGTALALALQAKLSPGGRERLVVRVRETDDVGRSFWMAMGARAVAVDRGRYHDTGEDAYRLELTAKQPAGSVMRLIAAALSGRGREGGGD